MVRPGNSKAPQFSDPSPSISHPLSLRMKKGARNSGPERAEPGPRPLHGPRGGSRGGEVAAPGTGRRKPEVSKSTEEAPGLGAQFADPLRCLVSPPLPHAGEAGPRPVRERGGGKPVLSLHREKLKGAHVLRGEAAAAPALAPKASHRLQPQRSVPGASPGRSPPHHRT